MRNNRSLNNTSKKNRVLSVLNKKHEKWRTLKDVTNNQSKNSNEDLLDCIPKSSRLINIASVALLLLHFIRSLFVCTFLKIRHAFWSVVTLLSSTTLLLKLLYYIFICSTLPNVVILLIVLTTIQPFYFSS